MRRRWSIGVVVAIVVAVWVTVGVGAGPTAPSTAPAAPITLAFGADSVSLRAGGVAIKFEF